MASKRCSLLCVGFCILCVGVGVVGAREPECLRQFKLEGSCAEFSVSGTLQPDDSQYVHDLFCQETGRRLGMVRMRWAFKYGARYGGVGYELVGEGLRLEALPQGGVRVCFPRDVREVVVVPRLATIPDR